MAFFERETLKAANDNLPENLSASGQAEDTAQTILARRIAELKAAEEAAKANNKQVASLPEYAPFNLPTAEKEGFGVVGEEEGFVEEVNGRSVLEDLLTSPNLNIETELKSKNAVEENSENLFNIMNLFNKEELSVFADSEIPEFRALAEAVKNYAEARDINSLLTDLSKTITVVEKWSPSEIADSLQSSLLKTLETKISKLEAKIPNGANIENSEVILAARVANSLNSIRERTSKEGKLPKSAEIFFIKGREFGTNVLEINPEASDVAQSFVGVLANNDNHKVTYPKAA